MFINTEHQYLQLYKELEDSPHGQCRTSEGKTKQENCSIIKFLIECIEQFDAQKSYIVDMQQPVE